MLLNILLVLHIIVCVLLIVFVLLQQSEGGALGMGGGPSGFMTARGAGNFLTRITWTLFGTFLLLSVGLTILFGHQKAASSAIGKGLTRDLTIPAAAPALPTQTAPAQPATGANGLGVPPTEAGLPLAPALPTTPAEPAPKQ
ncbi:MAG: preprotein translocase subunit SecG [Caulobacter sp.]|jgi:preprotein translocase subunit SecG|nr:preprotein translocase subunit SecG [Caulobacter sp.]